MGEDSSIRKFIFKISPDKLGVYLCSIEPSSPGFKTFREAKEQLAKLGVVFGVQEDRLKTAIESLEEGEKEQVVFAEPPTHGDDAYLEWHMDTDSKPKFIPNDGEDPVDYKDSMQIALVKEGDLLCEYHAATKGTQGTNIYGSAINPMGGMPLNLIKGAGVSVENNIYKATIEGKPLYFKDKISVLNVLEIEGDVCLKTGNLDFPGNIVVKGGVQDGFTIRCDGNIEVHGAVGDATLNAGKDIHLYAGVNGKTQATIIAGANVICKYVNNAYVEAGEDILITKDANHSSLFSLGFVRTKSGAIIGGKTVALKGVEAFNLGSDTGGKTIIKIKTHFESEKLADKLKVVLEQAYPFYKRYAPLLSQRSVLEKQLPEIEKVIKGLQKVLASAKAMEVKIFNYTNMASSLEGCSITVRKSIFADVVFLAPNCFTEFKELKQGSCEYVPDVALGKIVRK